MTSKTELAAACLITTILPETALRGDAVGRGCRYSYTYLPAAVNDQWQRQRTARPDQPRTVFRHAPGLNPTRCVNTREK